MLLPSPVYVIMENPAVVLDCLVPANCEPLALNDVVVPPLAFHCHATILFPLPLTDGSVLTVNPSVSNDVNLVDVSPSALVLLVPSSVLPTPLVESNTL